KEDLFNRTRPNPDEDFRWLVDVETSDLYDKPVINKKSHYGPKLLVKNGVFFTSKKTTGEHKFDFVPRHSSATPVQELGHVAFQTSGRIVFNSTQKVEFKFQDPSGI